MRRTHGYLDVIAFAMAIAILALMLASTGGLVPVVADLGDGHTRAHGKGTFERSDTYQADEGRITRNLVDGDVLTVCSTAFPAATREAIQRWNTRLGLEVLKFEEEWSKCMSTPPTSGWVEASGVLAVFVSIGEIVGGELRGSVLHNERCGSTGSTACVRQDYVSDAINSIWRTRYGRIEVIVNPEKFCRDAGVRPTDECAITAQPADQQIDDDLLYMITHELGHALSLGDYFCEHRKGGQRHPDFVDATTPTVMNSFSLSTSEDPNRRQLSRSCNSPDGSPTQLDVDDYRAIYRPAKVTGVGGTANGRTVTLTWNQSDVFVESEFEIQRASGAAWVDEATVEANASLATLTNQPGGVQRYRIVARTMALPEEEDGHGHAHGAPSAEVEVAVQLSVPTNARVAIRTPSSLSLTWDTVNGADRYELRRTTPNADCEGAVQATVTKPPHLFRNLTADTDYHLCVRAKLSTNSAVTSEWAEAAATTSPVPRLTVSVSPRSASCYTSGSVSISWTISNGTAPYAVSVDGSSASGSRKTVTCRSTAGTQTVSVTATDTSTPQRSGSASVSLAVTNPPPPPPPSRVRPPQPAPEVTTEEVGRTTVGWDWRPFGDLPGGGQPDPPGSCYFELYQRDRYSLAEFTTWWKFNTSRWKWELDESTKRQTGLQSAYIYTWHSTGRRHVTDCPDAAQGVSGASAPTAGTPKWHS